jgi:hypothetical protein
VRTLTVMSKTDMKKFAVGEGERIDRIDSKTGEPMWFKIEPVDLPNGDTVDVGAPWREPDPAENLTDPQMRQIKSLIENRLYSADPAEHRWVGFAIAKAIGIDLAPDNVRDNPQDLAKIEAIIKAASAKRKRNKSTAATGAQPKRSKPRTAA